jgi:hypothetical protein
MIARVLFGFALVVVLLLPGAAYAQGREPHLTTRVSSQTVEVGEPFTVELKAMAERGDAEPNSPELRAPAGFSISGPSVSTQTIAQFGAGGSTVQIGLGATWQLVASAAGRFVIPAPTVSWNGRRLHGDSITVDVMPSTGRPHAQQPGTSNPFLMPGGPGFNFSWPFGAPGGPPQLGDDDDDGAGVPELRLATAPDPDIFLHAVIDKKAAVVGEQVTISFYLYFRTDARIEENHDAPLPDFLRISLLNNRNVDELRASAGGHLYHVKLFDKVAVFPLREGDLHTGSMSVRFTGRHIGAKVLRESEDLVVHVTEPPREKRPAGYVLGDVGQFALGAEVQPKRIEQGGSVAVTLKVSGTGNLPQSLHVPERTGMDWLDPERKESIEPQGNAIGGWRTFGYVVRVKDRGRVRLGKVELPYWDPAAKRYQVASVDLGTIDVTPAEPAAPGTAGSAAPGDAAAAGDPFAALAGPRLALATFAPRISAPLEAGGRFWGLLVAPPGLVGLFFAGSAALRRLRERRALRKNDAETLAARALADAARAEARGDTKELAAALERALHAALERASGLKSRGVLLDDLPGELTRRGLDRALGDRSRDALAACEAIRFDPGGAGSAKDLGARTRTLVSELGRQRVDRQHASP